VIVTKSEGRSMQLLSLTPYLRRLGQHHDIDFKIDNNVGSLPVEEGLKKRLPGRTSRYARESQAMSPGQGWIARLFGGKQKINFPVVVRDGCGGKRSPSGWMPDGWKTTVVVEM